MPLDRSRRWLTVRDFADEVGVSISTAYKWSAAGRLRAVPPAHQAAQRVDPHPPRLARRLDDTP